MLYFRFNECFKLFNVNIFRMDFCICLSWLEKINVDFENFMCKSFLSICMLIIYVILLDLINYFVRYKCSYILKMIVFIIYSLYV